MDILTDNPKEWQRIEVYNEYLRKIPQLLEQLDTVENMYRKALLEEQMLPKCGPENESTEMYAARLARTREQCMARSADIRQQCRLILALKAQIESESMILQELMEGESSS